MARRRSVYNLTHHPQFDPLLYPLCTMQHVHRSGVVQHPTSSRQTTTEERERERRIKCGRKIGEISTGHLSVVFTNVEQTRLEKQIPHNQRSQKLNKERKNKCGRDRRDRKFAAEQKDVDGTTLHSRLLRLIVTGFVVR